MWDTATATTRWGRPKLLAHLQERLGVAYPKSYRRACPYPVSAGSLPDHMTRAQRFPAQSSSGS
ncbi:hypothetical protein [Kitasatospora sp. NPDC051914]|uniref:hypothetical protein n=1 Tax=Kitasatospora sp. NPDC051914 TaxID=3154945 RepID=UPI003448C51C